MDTNSTQPDAENAGHSQSGNLQYCRGQTAASLLLLFWWGGWCFFVYCGGLWTRSHCVSLGIFKVTVIVPSLSPESWDLSCVLSCPALSDLKLHTYNLALGKLGKKDYKFKSALAVK